jgi:hypothetical protein
MTDRERAIRDAIMDWLSAAGESRLTPEEADDLAFVIDGGLLASGGSGKGRQVERTAAVLNEADGHAHRFGRYLTLARALERKGLLASGGSGEAPAGLTESVSALEAVVWAKPCPGATDDHYVLHVSGEKLRAAKAALAALRGQGEGD